MHDIFEKCPIEQQVKGTRVSCRHIIEYEPKKRTTNIATSQR